MRTGATPMEEDGPGGNPVLFDAILHPNCSLGRRGFAVLMSAISAVGLTMAVLFGLSGAWPVSVLNLAVVFGVYWAFRINYRDAKRYEAVRLTADRLTVERGGPSRRPIAWSFQPYWLTVTLDDPPEHHSQITLSSHGRSLIVGRFLSPDDRQDLANALRAALARARQPDHLPA